MNIKEFKEGDIITRAEPCTYQHNGSKDGSYMGDKFTFVGVDEKAKLIVLHQADEKWQDGVTTLSYGREPWDEGWAYYPLSLIEKAKALLSTSQE